MYQQVSLSFIIFGLIILNLNWTIVLASSNSTEEKPIHIDANRGELDDRKQTAIYYGDVHLTQDDMKIDSDTLTIFYDENKKIEKMIAVGKPAWFHQLPSDGSKETKAKALRMEYVDNKSMIYLFKEAHVWQGEDDFTGDYIEYDTERRIVKGQGGEKGTSTGRIHVTIYPNEENSTAQKDKLGFIANTSKKEKKVTKNSLPTNTNLENHTSNKEHPEQIKSDGYTKTKLNLRSEASTKTKILALLPERTPITVLKTNGEWSQITAAISGKILKGWVVSRFINIEAKHQELEDLNLSEPQTKIMPEKDDINAKEDIKLPKNETIVTTKDKGTLEIIPEDELKSSEIEKYEIEETPALEGDLSDGRTKTWLKLLDRPHRKGKETALIPPRTQVVIYGHQGPWAHIATLVNGKAVKGWVKENDIRLKEGDDLEESS
ncbi:lipopolysaccharide transport periplasmic protein LptA [Candidatus Nitrosacidococcus sp. I8]|uniref:lipopolysaccharide transport periplasmic protein LptA n=1 Tax=Candidatus Nitrosacidococcus sp. I8 TaxID=2942908 RepID=UPI002226E2DE|nr:lipopolysaccharide transport periplasmic protein LptA [Candidatus Nitrosacidococcus sp. I8]CAH9019591.1 Lipopolysaccharide export system protein LptA [Candidatus Nitrosacidococcus sp. I8]